MSQFLKPLGYVGMAGLLLLILPSAASAAPITFNFNNCGGAGTTHGNCGTNTETYNSGGYSITATAYPGTANLYGKNGSGDEKGLGLTNDSTGDHEITVGSFIQLDISSILGNDPLTIIMNSTTGSDAWEIYESNTAGATSGTILKTGDNESAFTISPGDPYIDVTATHGNVLLHSLSFTPAATPEPSGLALLGTGILGMAGVVRRKLKV